MTSAFGVTTMRMTEQTIRARLGRGFDPKELRDIKRLWVRHSIAEDRRNIDGLMATLTEDAVYEIVPTGQRWERRNLIAEPRSVYLLRAAARTEWEHSIPGVESLRYSITFRIVLERDA